MAIVNIVRMKTLLWYVLFSFSKRSVFTFIIIKPKTKLCFSFSNIGSIVTNFASQKVENLFWVTVKEPTLNFKYFSTCFCCEGVSCNYMITTWQVPLPHGSEPSIIQSMLRHFGGCGCSFTCHLFKSYLINSFIY